MRDIEIDQSEFDAAIERVQALMRDASPIMSLVSALMADAVEENFAAEGRPKWLGLSRNTLKRRKEDAGVHQKEGCTTRWRSEFFSLGCLVR